MTIRDIYAAGTRRVVQREAICDRCGWTSGILPARKLTFQRATEAVAQHHRTDCIDTDKRRMVLLTRAATGDAESPTTRALAREILRLRERVESLERAEEARINPY